MKTLNARWDRLEQAVHSIKRLTFADTPIAGDDVVFVGNTAYNFLNVFLRPPETIFESKIQLSENQLYAIQCASSESAFAVFGILTSHLAYWWWHTQGDGFHVSRRFITNFPFGNDVLDGPRINLLSEIGSDLWSAVNSGPTMSLNRGRTSLAYNPNCHPQMRRSVDRVLVNASGLNGGFVDELQQFTEHMIAAAPRNHANRYTVEEGRNYDATTR